VAHGDDGRDPWGATTAVQPTDGEAYDRQFVALGLLLTLPGIPTIYYGDEVGLAGGGDPDSRRVMPGELGQRQAELLSRTGALARLRRCVPALRRGARVPLVVGSTSYAFARDAEAVVLVSTATQQSTITLPASAPQGAFVDALTGEVVTIGGEGAQVPMGPLSLRVLVPQGHACVL
jgi:alpha-glucosidase